VEYTIKRLKKQTGNDGMEKGMEKEKINITKNLLMANVAIDVISVTTGLTIKSIEELKRES